MRGGPTLLAKNPRIPPKSQSLPPSLTTTLKQRSNPTLLDPKLDPRYLPRRSKALAVGVAIIIFSGTILGAQWKSSDQAAERAVAQKAFETVEDGQKAGNETVRLAGSNGQTTTRTVPPSTDADLQKQIVFLEERRATLVAQKTKLEQKLEEVRRKQKHQEEIEKYRKLEVEIRKRDVANLNDKR